jgi:threonine aldolase
VYLDGARLFNAAAAMDVPATDYTRRVDALMFCLSKGLGAPIGSVMAGSSEFIREARRLKILLGGAWRQAGITAAAGLVALEDGPKRLHEDHARARRLAEALADRFPGSVDPDRVQTNIVCASASALPASFLDDLAADGVRAGTIDQATVRLVTHKDVDDADLDRAVAAINKAGR